MKDAAAAKRVTAILRLCTKEFQCFRLITALAYLRIRHAAA